MHVCKAHEILWQRIPKFIILAAVIVWQQQQGNRHICKPLTQKNTTSVCGLNYTGVVLATVQHMLGN